MDSSKPENKEMDNTSAAIANMDEVLSQLVSLYERQQQQIDVIKSQNESPIALAIKDLCALVREGMVGLITLQDKVNMALIEADPAAFVEYTKVRSQYAVEVSKIFADVGPASIENYITAVKMQLGTEFEN